MASQHTGYRWEKKNWEMLYIYTHTHIGKVCCKQKKYLNLILVLKFNFQFNFIVTYQTQVLDCQFQMRIVWSSEALRIQGYSYRQENENNFMNFRVMLSVVYRIPRLCYIKVFLSFQNYSHDGRRWFWYSPDVQAEWKGSALACSSKPTSKEATNNNT